MANLRDIVGGLSLSDRLLASAGFEIYHTHMRQRFPHHEALDAARKFVHAKNPLLPFDLPNPANSNVIYLDVERAVRAAMAERD